MFFREVSVQQKNVYLINKSTNFINLPIKIIYNARELLKLLFHDAQIEYFILIGKYFKNILN